jgi:hypothetical protein
MICELLLNRNSHLLPTCRIEEGAKGARLGIHLPGTRDQHGNDFWIDVAKFGEKLLSGGQQVPQKSPAHSKVPAEEAS